MKRIAVFEHDHEPVPGLPARLPEGEYIVWQGRPSSRLVARQVLKTRWLAGYFVLLGGWAVAAGISDGRDAASLLFSAGVLAAMAGVLIALAELYAWAVEKTSLYTVTNARVVMKIGVGLPVILNLPFASIRSAAMSRRTDGTGNVALEVARDVRVSWFILWPHSREWRINRPEPALICLRDVEEAARVITAELARFQAQAGADETAPAGVPAVAMPSRPRSRPRAGTGVLAGQPGE